MSNPPNFKSAGKSPDEKIEEAGTEILNAIKSFFEGKATLKIGKLDIRFELDKKDFEE